MCWKRKFYLFHLAANFHTIGTNSIAKTKMWTKITQNTITTQEHLVMELT